MLARNKGKKMTMKHTYALAGLACLFSTTSALAWDPMEGADDISRPVKTMKVMPAYNPPLRAPVLVAPAPAFVPAPPAPVAAPAPIAYAPAPAPVMAAAPVAAPMAVSSYSDTPVQPLFSRQNRFAVGVEGFYDHYEVESVDLTSRAQYGSLTAEFTHYYDPHWFNSIEARGSYGSEDYKSVSGTLKDVSQYEFEGRALAGYDVDYGNGRHFKPYIGLGARHYRDNGKDEVTSLGLAGFDRRITQFYLPIGFAFEFPAYGLQFAPRVEFDPLLYGNVSSRRGNVAGFENVENDQREGYGWRAEFMMGQVNERGAGWQFGPFLRMWHMRDSENETDSTGTNWVEPRNNRWQAGAAFKLLF